MSIPSLVRDFRCLAIKLWLAMQIVLNFIMIEILILIVAIPFKSKSAWAA